VFLFSVPSATLAAMNRFTIIGALGAVLFGLLPFVTSRDLFYGTVNAKYFFVTAIVMALLLLVAFRLWSGFQFVNIKQRVFFLTAFATLAVYWLSALLGAFPMNSLFADIQRSSGVFFFTHIFALAVILGEFLTERDWSLVRRAVAISGGVFGFLTFLGAEGLGFSGHFLGGNLSATGFTFGNTTFAGTYLLLALLAALIEIVKTAPRTRWWYTLLAAAAGLVFSPILFNVGIFWGVTPLGALFDNPLLVLASARASSAAALLLLAFFGGYLLLRKYTGDYRRYALFAWASLFLIAIFSGIAFLFTPGSYVQQKYIEASTETRLVVWGIGFEAFKERPYLGWGSENFDRAHQSHFDNRLYEEETLQEIWFDRAHNVIVDTLVDVGVVGVLAILASVAVYLWTVYRALIRRIIEEPEAMLLFALPCAHFLQLQTGFDTIGSFALLGLFLGYGLWLERQLLIKENGEAEKHRAVNPIYYHKGVAVALVILAILSAKFLFFDEIIRQTTLFKLFHEKDTQKQLALARVATSRLSSFESLQFPAASLIKGVLDATAEKRLASTSIETALQQMAIYEERYRRYLEVQPDLYRAHVNFAYLLAVQRALGGEDQLQEAKEIMARGRELSPGNVLNPVMEALLELYSGNPKAAIAKAEEAVALNPKAPLGHEVLEYMQAQEKKFPAITVLRLENI